MWRLLIEEVTCRYRNVQPITYVQVSNNGDIVRYFLHMLNISNFKTMFNAIPVCSTVFSIISICICINIYVQVSNGDNVHFATCMFNSIIISIMYVQVSNGDHVQHYLHVGPYIGDVSQEAEPGRYGSLCHIKVKVMKLYDY